MISLLISVPMILSGDTAGFDQGYAKLFQTIDLCIMAGIAMVVFS